MGLSGNLGYLVSRFERMEALRKPGWPVFQDLLLHGFACHSDGWRRHLIPAQSNAQRRTGTVRPPPPGESCPSAGLAGPQPAPGPQLVEEGRHRWHVSLDESTANPSPAISMRIPPALSHGHC
eukprot:gene7378-biopygen5858